MIFEHRELAALRDAIEQLPGVQARGPQIESALIGALSDIGVSVGYSRVADTCQESGCSGSAVAARADELSRMPYSVCQNHLSPPLLPLGETLRLLG